MRHLGARCLQQVHVEHLGEREQARIAAYRRTGPDPTMRIECTSRRANADLDPNLSMGFDLAREVRLFYVASPRAIHRF